MCSWGISHWPVIFYFVYGSSWGYFWSSQLWKGYADDTQVYVILKNDSDSSSIIAKLERCINDIKVWSSANGLKLNEHKTEVIHMNSRFRNPCHLPFVNFADVPIQPVKSARNLGVIFENDLNRWMDT